jgi:methylthioribose-1-phosphate isomerase
VHVETIRWEGGLDGCVRLLDQTLLPGQQVYLEITTVEELRDAIARLAVRGAPAIGVAAAFGVVLGARTACAEGSIAVFQAARDAAMKLIAARPTAVNLEWGAGQVVGCAGNDFVRGRSGVELAELLLAKARSVWEQDRAVCEKLGEVGVKLLRDGSRVLTHCNAGALATAGRGTALAPVYVASERGMKVSVIADETRPLLQGARLTAWELSQAGIDVTLITDSMAASVFSQGKVDLVLVGADRIARNGDVANKIGTYGVAVLAREHQVPFYVVAPLSTFDRWAQDGSKIPIEERDAGEVTTLQGVRVYNPAFDVTPARLVTGIVTEVGLIEQPDRARVEDALRRGGRIA